MARGRLISRTLGSSRKFAALQTEAGKLGEFAQTLYPLLICNSDDFGRMAGDAFTVKLAVFPSSRRREEQFAEALRAMAVVGLIRWYDANGLQVIQIVDFEPHQPNLHKRTESKFPEYSGTFPDVPGISRSRARPEFNLRELKGTELKGIEEKRKDQNKPAPKARRDARAVENRDEDTDRPAPDRPSPALLNRQNGARSQPDDHGQRVEGGNTREGGAAGLRGAVAGDTGRRDEPGRTRDESSTAEAARSGAVTAAGNGSAVDAGGGEAVPGDDSPARRALADARKFVGSLPPLQRHARGARDDSRRPVAAIGIEQDRGADRGVASGDAEGSGVRADRARMGEA